VQTLTGESGPAPDRLVDGSLRSAEYGAIVFAGLSTEEYHPGSETGNEVARLLKEFERERKVIASICAGQRALARHGYLDGKRAAYCQYLEPDDVVRAWDYTRSVVEDQSIITASADRDSADLAQTIAGHLGQ
jgi:putative intracellular protease/amidase